MSSKYLIAYSSYDIAWVKMLVDHIKNQGFDIWFDTEKIEGGDNFLSTLERELNSRDLLVIVSPESQSSKWVQLEINYALSHNKRIIPILYKPTLLTGFLASRQGINIIGLSPNEAVLKVTKALTQVDPAPIILDKIDKDVRLFISHSSKDNKITERIVADLFTNGTKSIWVDYNEITSGDFYESINNGLSESNWLILIVSPYSLDSAITRREVNAAFSLIDTKEMKGIICVTVSEFDISKMPPIWRNLHRYDTTQDYKKAISGISKALGLI